MSTTIDQAVEKVSTPKRRHHSSFEVLQVVTELADQGMKLPDIARCLEMSDARDGALCRALRRAGRHDLVRAISPASPPAAEGPAPALAEDRKPTQLPDRRAVRRGGIVRWVAA